MEEKPNYRKIIAVTVAVVAGASAIACLIYHLCRKFFKFCDSYRDDAFDDSNIDFEELEEEMNDTEGKTAKEGGAEPQE